MKCKSVSSQRLHSLLEQSILAPHPPQGGCKYMYRVICIQVLPSTWLCAECWHGLVSSPRHCWLTRHQHKERRGALTMEKNTTKSVCLSRNTEIAFCKISICIIFKELKDIFGNRKLQPNFSEPWSGIEVKNLCKIKRCWETSFLRLYILLIYNLIFYIIYLKKINIYI